MFQIEINKEYLEKCVNEYVQEQNILLRLQTCTNHAPKLSSNWEKVIIRAYIQQNSNYTFMGMFVWHGKIALGGLKLNINDGFKFIQECL